MAAADFPNPPLSLTLSLSQSLPSTHTHAHAHTHTRIYTSACPTLLLLLQNNFFFFFLKHNGGGSGEYKVAIFDRFVSGSAMQKARVVACDLASDSDTRQVCRIRD